MIAINGQWIVRAELTAAGNTIDDIRNIDVTPIPEPTSLAMTGLGLGMLGLGAVARRRRAHATT